MRRTEAGVEITDLDSRNGTRVNGHRVSLAVLEVGDVVRVGAWIGVVTDARGSLVELAPGLFGGPTLARAVNPL